MASWRGQFRSLWGHPPHYLRHQGCNGCRCRIMPKIHSSRSGVATGTSVSSSGLAELDQWESQIVFQSESVPISSGNRAFPYRALDSFVLPNLMTWSEILQGASSYNPFLGCNIHPVMSAGWSKLETDRDWPAFCRSLIESGSNFYNVNRILDHQSYNIGWVNLNIGRVRLS